MSFRVPAGGSTPPTRSRAGRATRAVGPEHAYLFEAGRVEYVSVTDEEALRGFHLCCKTEGIIPALESAHAVAYAEHLAATLPREAICVINMSGRGDKDVQIVAELGRASCRERV